MIGATSTRLSAEIRRQAALSTNIARAQTDISSKTRIQVGSDDPTAAARVAGIRRESANADAWTTNIDAGAATATRVDSALESHANNLVRAQELLINARNATLSPEARAAIATELAGIADDVTAAATAKDVDGRDLFPAGTPLKLPIGEGVTTAATVSRGAAFGSVADTLRAAATAVTAGDDAGMDAGLDGVVAASDALAQVRGEHGVRAARLDAAREALTNRGVDLAEERGLLEGTDLGATVAALQADMLTLSAAQSIFAKLNSKSLFDLL